MKSKEKTNEILDCLCLGISPVDYLCIVDHFPGADEKMHARTFTRQGGGPASTAAAALGRWGARAALVSVAGDDDDGRFARASLSADGVDVSLFKLLPGARSPRSFIIVTPSAGTRAVVTENTGVRGVRPSDIPLAALPPARVFHTDGRDTDACLKAMRHYRKQGAFVSFDAGSPRPRMDELAALTTHFIASHSFMREHFGPRINPIAACKRILDWGPEVAVVTLGPRGCVGAVRDSGEFIAPGHHRDNFIVDTTGAGDVFHAGFIYGLLQNWTPERCAAFANAAAFLKCAKPGGRAGIASVPKILELMKR